MKKLLSIAGIFGGLMFLGLLMIGGFGDGKAVPVPVDEDDCYNYQYAAYQLGVDWEISLIIDLYDSQRENKKTLEDLNYLISTLNSAKLKEEVYREETEEEEDGSTTTNYVYETTNYYTGAVEIMLYLGISKTEKSVDTVLSAVAARENKEHRYSWEREADIQTVLNDFYDFSDSEKKSIINLYESHYYASVYENQFGSAEDVYLEDLIIAPNGMAIPLFKQYDPLWKSIKFGGGNILTSGCSVTSMSMVFSYLLDKTILPPTIVSWTGNRYYIAPSGQSWSIFPACANQWGLTCRNLGTSSTAVVNALSSGKPVIASVKPGTFTKSGHFIVLRGVTSNGKILVNDPNDNASKNFVNRQFELSLIMREAKNFWSFE